LKVGREDEEDEEDEDKERAKELESLLEDARNWLPRPPNFGSAMGSGPPGILLNHSIEDSYLSDLYFVTKLLSGPPYATPLFMGSV
jgi:hypothetical protein